MIPCKECISLAICKHKATVVCPILMDYTYKKERVGDHTVSVSYTKFIEARQILPKMDKLVKEKIQKE